MRPDARHVTYGDVGPRQRLRRLMKCQTFDWYLQNVYPELSIPGKEDNKTSKKETNNKIQPRLKYNRKNYIATYQVNKVTFPLPYLLCNYIDFRLNYLEVIFAWKVKKR